MKVIIKYTTAIALTGAVALAAVAPSEARNGRNAAAAIGFGAGALVGAAAASSAYSSGYYYGPDAEPGYAYEPAPVYVEPYAYEPAPYYSGYSSWSYGKDQSIRSQR